METDVALRLEGILNYVQLCGVVDSEVLNQKFFQLEGANPKTRRDVCARYLRKMVDRKEIYRMRGVHMKNYMYSIKPFSKSKSVLTYTQMALESRAIFYLEQLGYDCLSIRRDYTLQKGFKIPCTVWLRWITSNEDEFYFVEIASTKDRLDRVLEKYNYIYSSSLYESTFNQMPTLVIKTDFQVPDTSIKVIRIPYTTKDL